MDKTPLERELSEALYAMNRALNAHCDTLSGPVDELYLRMTSVRDDVWALITTVNPERKD